MSELAGDADLSAMHLPAEHEPGADPARDLDKHQVLGAGMGAPAVLGQGSEVGVVVHDDRHGQALGQRGTQLQPHPLRQDGGVAHDAGPRVDGSGDADPRADQLGPAHAGVGQGAIEHQIHERHAALGPMTCRDAFVGLGEHRPVLGGEEQAHVPPPHVDADGDGELLAGQGHPDRTTPGRGGGTRRHQTLVAERPDQVGDGGGREAGGPRERRLGHRPPGPQGVDHPLVVGPS